MVEAILKIVIKVLKGVVAGKMRYRRNRKQSVEKEMLRFNIKTRSEAIFIIYTSISFWRDVCRANINGSFKGAAY